MKATSENINWTCLVWGFAMLFSTFGYFVRMKVFIMGLFASWTCRKHSDLDLRYVLLWRVKFRQRFVRGRRAAHSTLRSFSSLIVWISTVIIDNSNRSLLHLRGVQSVSCTLYAGRTQWKHISRFMHSSSQGFANVQ